MRAAIYARVSTERQGRNQTIDSQLTALRAWVASAGHELLEAHVFRDEAFSGSRLDRPALDALRDAVRDAAVEIIAVLSPDRLARKYAYQVLLLEEFRRAGCEVVFLEHPISENPNDQLLLQIQGAIAEYERAVLAERFRRGKLQKARDGQFLGGRAPYGYRHVHRRDGVPGHLVVDETEAELVHTLYAWLIEEQMTIRQMLKRLNASPWRPRSGRGAWAPSVVQHILSDPVYTGTAYTNRYEHVPAKRPRARGPYAGQPTVRRIKPRAQWIAIPVPPLIDQATAERARAQLARNAQLSFRNNTKYNYLLRCLLTCEHCGLAMFGRTHRARGTQAERRTYTCHGKDCILSAREAICPSRTVLADALERVVWDHVAGLLLEPEQLTAQFTQFITAARESTAQEKAAEQQLRARLDGLMRADTRLVDAYQAGAISLAELTERRHALTDQRRAVDGQRAERQRVHHQRLQAQDVLNSLHAVADRIHERLAAPTVAEKQAILQLVIERIIIGDDILEIRHVIPLRPLPPGHLPPATPPSMGLGPDPPPMQLCSDRVCH
jgi:site-specific DNA recombinase